MKTAREKVKIKMSREKEKGYDEERVSERKLDAWHTL